jgi:hypothetical protein
MNISKKKVLVSKQNEKLPPVHPDGGFQMSSILNAKERVRYIKSGGAKCPFCGNDDIEGGPIQTDEGCALQKIECHVCGEFWNDIYSLIDIESLSI